MNRKEAVEIICKQIQNEIIVSANGFISRDLFSTLEKEDVAPSKSIMNITIIKKIDFCFCENENVFKPYSVTR